MTLLNTTLKHIRRTPFQSLTAILANATTFFLLTAFITLLVGLAALLSNFETKPEITLFVKDGLDKTTVENIQKELSTYPNIKEIKFISKDRALAIYKDQNKDNPLLTEMVTASILPASFEVSVTQAQTLETIYQNFSTKTDIITDIIYQKNIIQDILKWTNIIRNFGFALVIFQTCLSFLVIFIIIGMKITNRKEEIKISRLLGASKHYVKKPFLLEAVIYGISGAAIGGVTCSAIALLNQATINQFFSPVIFIQNNIVFYFLILLAELFLGTIIGLLSGFFGVRRHIKF